MTALAQIIARQIAATGPISIADYMALCLGHPQHGYYTTRDPLGADFTTAPEISQMFGELLGLAIAQSWVDAGSPRPFCLLELGPGRGTLMADILRAARAVPGFGEAAEVSLLETSPTLRAAQSARVPSAHHRDSLADLPDHPLFIVANEFFDCLPIRQFIRMDAGWSERVVGLAEDTLTFGRTEPAPLEGLPDRDFVETCAPATQIVDTLAAHMALHGGAAFVIDYGDAVPLGNTLQSLRAHEKVDPLVFPGDSDLTAHVAFEPLLAQAASHGLMPSALTPQGVFLERLGITPRAQSLAKHLSGEPLTQHIAAHRRLTHPEEMGTLFKVAGFRAHGSPLPGLDDP